MDVALESRAIRAWQSPKGSDGQATNGHSNSFQIEQKPFIRRREWEVDTESVASSKKSVKPSSKENWHIGPSTRTPTAPAQPIRKAIFEPHHTPPPSETESETEEEDDTDMGSVYTGDEWIGQDERASDAIPPSITSTRGQTFNRTEPPRTVFEMPVFAAESQKENFYRSFFGRRYENLMRLADKNKVQTEYVPFYEVIKIWGPEANARKAQADFKSFSDGIIADAETNSKKTRGWSKPDRELTERQIRRKERAERKLAELRRYQGMPDPEVKFPYVGIFDWPKDEKIDPLRVLGMSLEDLDPIRRDCRVYILFSRNFSVLRVLGHEPALVEEAVERICNIYLERASAIRNKTRHLTIHVVHPPDVQYALPEVMYDLQHLMIGREIMIRKVEGWNGATFKLTRDSQGAPYSMEELQDWRMKLRDIREPMILANRATLRAYMQQALHNMVYYRGDIKLSIQIGTPVLFSYPGRKVDYIGLEKFMTTMKNPKIQSELIRYVGTSSAHKKFIDSSVLEFERFNLSLKPHECITNLRFDLNISESSISHLRLDLDINPVTKKPLAWKLTGPRHRAAELNTFVIETGLAWQINMTFAKHIDASRDPMFEQFINRIHLDDEGRACFSNLPTISVHSVVQKTKHRSWFKSTPFVLELTKYEYFDVKTLAQSVPNGVQVSLNRRPLDERVGAALFDPRWQSLWAEAKDLPIGKAPSLWDKTIDGFFGEDNCGKSRFDLLLDSATDAVQWISKHTENLE